MNPPPLIPGAFLAQRLLRSLGILDQERPQDLPAGETPEGMQAVKMDAYQTYPTFPPSADSELRALGLEGAGVRGRNMAVFAPESSPELYELWLRSGGMKHRYGGRAASEND